MVEKFIPYYLCRSWMTSAKEKRPPSQPMRSMKPTSLMLAGPVATYRPTWSFKSETRRKLGSNRIHLLLVKAMIKRTSTNQSEVRAAIGQKIVVADIPWSASLLMQLTSQSLGGTATHGRHRMRNSVGESDKSAIDSPSSHPTASWLEIRYNCPGECFSST